MTDIRIVHASWTDKCTFGQTIYVQNKYFVEKTHKHEQINDYVQYDIKKKLVIIGKCYIKVEKQFKGKACLQNNFEIILQCRMICIIDKISVCNNKF